MALVFIWRIQQLPASTEGGSQALNTLSLNASAPGFWLFMCVWGEFLQTIIFIQRSEGSLRELILSLHYLGVRDQTQVIRLGGKWPYYLLCHFASLAFFLYLWLWHLPKTSDQVFVYTLDGSREANGVPKLDAVQTAVDASPESASSPTLITFLSHSLPWKILTHSPPKYSQSCLLPLLPWPPWLEAQQINTRPLVIYGLLDSIHAFAVEMESHVVASCGALGWSHGSVNLVDVRNANKIQMSALAWGWLDLASIGVRCILLLSLSPVLSLGSQDRSFGGLSMVFSLCPEHPTYISIYLASIFVFC